MRNIIGSLLAASALTLACADEDAHRTERKQRDAAAKHEIEWRWVRGHSGNVGNERADELANLGVESVSASDYSA